MAKWEHHRTRSGIRRHGADETRGFLGDLRTTMMYHGVLTPTFFTLDLS